jgi:hypothetical protein
MVVCGVTLEHSQEKETQQDILAGFYFQAAVKQTVLSEYPVLLSIRL